MNKHFFGAAVFFSKGPARYLWRIDLLPQGFLHRCFVVSASTEDHADCTRHVPTARCSAYGPASCTVTGISVRAPCSGGVCFGELWACVLIEMIPGFSHLFEFISEFRYEVCCVGPGVLLRSAHASPQSLSQASGYSSVSWSFLGMIVDAHCAQLPTQSHLFQQAAFVGFTCIHSTDD